MCGLGRCVCGATACPAHGITHSLALSAIIESGSASSLPKNRFVIVAAAAAGTAVLWGVGEEGLCARVALKEN